MRDFDAVWDAETEEERTFKVRGEIFVLREAVRPEAMADKLAFLESVRDDPNTGVAEVMAAVDEFIIVMIDPKDDAEARYREVRSREDGGLSAARMQDVQAWILEKQMGLVEEQTGRPPTSPLGSSTGSRSAATSSTDSSSSPALQAV